MTVKELIEELEKYDEDMKVYRPINGKDFEVEGLVIDGKYDSYREKDIFYVLIQ